MKKDDKSIVGNKGYRCFLSLLSGEDRFAIDRARAEEDDQLYGVFVLRTNADLSPLEATFAQTSRLVEDGCCDVQGHCSLTDRLLHKLERPLATTSRAVSLPAV